MTTPKVYNKRYRKYNKEAHEKSSANERAEKLLKEFCKKEREKRKISNEMIYAKMRDTSTGYHQKEWEKRKISNKVIYNEVGDTSTGYHQNGKLSYKITEYKKIMNIKKINPYFDEKYADEIKRVYEIHDINGVIESVTGYSGFDDTDFKSQEIIYKAGKIDCVKTYFKNKFKKDYYENEKLKRTVLRKKIKGEWEDYKTIYYDENGNKKETVYEIEEEEGFFGRIFSGLGASLSEKIKETDVKETLININSALEKYKK